MSDDRDDNEAPIEELNYLHPQIIDFGDARIARGKARYEFQGCQHKHLTYDLEERRVWCTDCQKSVPGFDAFMMIVKQYQHWWNQLADRQTKIEQMEKVQLHLRAARSLEKSWMGRRAPECVSCRSALLPEDYVGGRFKEKSLELARQARKKK